MKKITRQELIDALRSGKYEQTGGFLFRHFVNGERKGMCCLGVVLDLQGAVWEPCTTAVDAEQVFVYYSDVHGPLWGKPYYGDMPDWMSEQMIEALMLTNDSSAEEGWRDYTKVLELLEDEAWVFRRTPIEYFESLA